MKTLIDQFNKEVKLYNAKEEKIQATIEKLESSIERAKKRLQRHQSNYPNWIDLVVQPLAEKLAYARDGEYRIYGPLGLRCRTFINILPRNSVDIPQRYPSWSIVLVPHLDETGFSMYYETGAVKEGSFPQNSIGKINNMDREIAPLPDNIEEINALLKFKEASL